MPPTVPHWEYESHKDRVSILRTVTASLYADLRNGTIDCVAALCDTRPFHKRLFTELTPPAYSGFAGNYRGQKQPPYLRRYEVGVPANPLVGERAVQVNRRMVSLATRTRRAIARLDSSWGGSKDDTSDGERLFSVVQAACEWFSEFLVIHPYANGNGHVARFGLLAFLGRYGYWPSSFTIEPRPFGDVYSKAILEHQNGTPEPLEELVLNAIAAG